MKKQKRSKRVPTPARQAAVAPPPPPPQPPPPVGTTPIPQEPAKSRSSWFAPGAKFFGFLAGSGILLAVGAATYEFVMGNVLVDFTQARDRGYEFQIKNDTPADFVVDSLRFYFPDGFQWVVMGTTKEAKEENERTGRAVPKEIRSLWIIDRYTEADGLVVPARATRTFFPPGLMSKPDVEPIAAVVELEYTLSPKNSMLALFRGLSRKQSARYLVVKNQWILTTSTSLEEAVRVACRNDQSLARSMDLCKPHVPLISE